MQYNLLWIYEIKMFCKFLPVVVVTILLLGFAVSVPLSLEDVDGSDDTTADLAILIKRLKDVVNDQKAQQMQEKRQPLKNQLMKRIEELDNVEREHLMEMLSQRDVSRSWWCPWCGIGTKMRILITKLCKEKNICFNEFNDIIQQSSTGQ